MNTGSIILILFIIILIGVIAVLLLNNFKTNESLRKLKNTNQKVASLNVLQDFIEVISNSVYSSEEKMNKINSILTEKYEIKFSTIVIFDGIKYKVESSNVSEKHFKMFEQLHTQEIFEDSIKNATPKYITVNQGEKLPYLDNEFERAKSAIFFPIYVDNIYMGYWLIEGNKPHEFDNIDTTTLDVVKNNLISAIKIIRKQGVIENIARYDDVTGLNTYEYLYGTGRKTIDKYPTSIVSLIKIINLQQIEEKASKKTAESALKGISEYIKSCLSPEYILVRYSNDELAIVFSGSESEGVSKFLANLKATIEQLRIKIINSLREDLNGQVVLPKLNIAVTSYYKETALENILINLDEYLEETDANESDITFL
ncbi:MAG: diguanylate cyclase [Clostridia bacterium]|nr:diguanylate cyclase [Clostridia bacterium]